MRPRTCRHLLIVLLACVACAPAAWAAGASPVISDCNAHNALTHHYSLQQLQSALRSLPADVREYTDCQDVIQRQILVQEGKLHPGSGGTSGSSSASSGLPGWLIAVIVVLGLAAAVLGALALRTRRTG